jgi:hypothetical protein
MTMIPGDERTVRDTDVFNALDLTRSDLAEVRRAFEAGDLPAAKRTLVEHFRVRQHPRWFFDLRDGKRGEMPSSWSGYDPAAIRHADEALRNRFHLAGDLVWDFGKDLRWRTIEMRGLGSAPSIFKRCHFLRDLAVAYAGTGRSVYAAKFAELVNRWLTDWPLVVDPEFGPTDAIFSRSDGHKTMPTAFRVITWIDVLYGGIVFAPDVPMDTAFGLIKAIWFTALQYRRYETSPYKPANHHLWERGTAPFIFGTMLPEFPEVAKLAEQGRPVIGRHAKNSFLSDGGYEERSTSYTFAALRMFLVPLRLAMRNRVALLDRKELDRLKRCGENVALITLPDGSQPDIGDGHPSQAATGRMLGAITSLFESRIAASAVKSLRLTCDVDPEDRHVLEELDPLDLPLTVYHPASGYFVARDAWIPQASVMSFSVPGPGLMSNHAHDDALFLQLVVRGTPMVGTPMTELYSFLNQDRCFGTRPRGHFYAMTSHNLVLVEGQPARSIESLAPRTEWGAEPIPVQTTWEKIAGGIRVVGVHTGYPGVTLSREVVFRYRKGWILRDRVEGRVEKPHIARWHFEYGVVVTEEDGGFVATRGQARLGIRVSPEGTARLYRDMEWFGENPLRPDEPAPWVLDVTFGGTGDDILETHFEILKNDP